MVTKMWTYYFRNEVIIDQFEDCESMIYNHDKLPSCYRGVGDGFDYGYYLGLYGNYGETALGRDLCELIILRNNK